MTGTEFRVVHDEQLNLLMSHFMRSSLDTAKLPAVYAYRGSFVSADSSIICQTYIADEEIYFH